MKGQTYVILTIILVIIISIFAVTNVDPVEVNYLVWSGESPLILVILFSLLMGGVITATVGSVRNYHVRREIKTLEANNRKMKSLLKENNLFVEEEQKQNNNK